MAIQILPSQEGFGTVFGRAAGRGLAGALENLVQGHVKKQGKQQEYDYFKKAGLNDMQAHLLSHFHGNLPAQQKILMGLNIEQPETGTSALSNLSPEQNWEQLAEQLGGEAQEEEQPQEKMMQQQPNPPNTPIPQNKPAPSLQPQRTQEAKPLFKQKGNAKNEIANKPYNTRITQAVSTAENLYTPASRMYHLLKSGNVSSGKSGAFKAGLSEIPYIGSSLLNDESQQFLADSNSVASLLSSGPGQGVQTISKIRFNQQRKPNLSQSNNTQLRETINLLQDTQKVLLKGQIRQQILENSEGEPAKLETIVNSQFKKIEQFLDKLNASYDPLKNKVKDGDTITDDQTGNTIAYVKDGIWWPII